VSFYPVRGPARPVLLAYPWFMAMASLAVHRRRRGTVQVTGASVLNRVDVIAVHYCHRVGPAGPSRSTVLFRLHSRLVGSLKLAAERWCFRRNRGAIFVCVSAGGAKEVAAHYPGLAERVIVIHNGVDTDVFAPGRRRHDAREARARMQIPPGRLVLAFVGGEWERKGLAPVIGALPLAREWDLVVAGRGDRERYGALAHALGVAQSIHWRGVERDPALVYGLADAFVLPSSYETFSLVTFEAAASGLPVLVTAVNGVAELIKDGHSGLFITRDPEVIAARLRLLAGDPGLRASLGAAARDSAFSFSWRRMIDAYHLLYMSLPAARS
jgi:UDP-glucose:(heptosyl)LPS alpha-1,3-glucosyltransferase